MLSQRRVLSRTLPWKHGNDGPLCISHISGDVLWGSQNHVALFGLRQRGPPFRGIYAPVRHDFLNQLAGFACAWHILVVSVA